MSPKSPLILTALASVVVAVAFAHPRQALAINPCSTDFDQCVYVNSNLDNDVRDDVITLREALLLANGTLTLADLTIAELGQVVITMPPGWGPQEDSYVPLTPPGFGGPGGIGKTAVHFDRIVFCDGCVSNTIFLDPVTATADLVGMNGAPSHGISAALPVLAPTSDSVADVSDWQVQIGDESVGSADISVNIDGSRLGTEATGLGVAAPGVRLQGVTLRQFRGAAVSLTCTAATETVMDVAFANNGTDILADSCWSEMP